MTLDDLAHDVRNGVLGAEGALLLCDTGKCPLGLGRVQVIMEIRHHLNRIDRALRVYVSYQESKSLESTSNT